MTESKADETPVAAEGAPPSAVYEVPSPVDSLANANPAGDLAHLAGMTTPASGFGAAVSEQERKDAELAAELQAAAQADSKRIVVEGVPFPTSTRPHDEDLLPPYDDFLYFVDNFGCGWFCAVTRRSAQFCAGLCSLRSSTHVRGVLRRFAQ